MVLIGALGNYVLEDKLAEGGEGAVWTVSGNGAIVVKVYHPEKITSDPKLERKITYMVNNPPADSILDQIAWPKDVLRDKYGAFAGFIMPKLDTDTDLKNIYPYPPKKEMPITTEQKLIVAINICIVISEVHKAGYIFGDFNPMNIGVNLTNGHVAFFDADSYHFTNQENGETYRCGVGADGYIAPELIQRCHDYGSDFLGTPLPTFTKETDEFALAIHIFKLLMNGYTPFNGIKECESVSQSSPGTGNIAIERDNYCFKAGNKPQSLATPNLNSMPSGIQILFKKTFIGGNTNPGDRASADEWRNALKDYHDSLIVCSNNPMHYYFKDNKQCPFCEADKRYNTSIMGATQTYGTGSNGLSTPQYSFVNPVSIPQNTIPNSFVNPISIPQNTIPNTGGYNQTNNQASVNNKKRRLPLPLTIILWVVFFPIMIAVYIFKKKDMNILLRLFLFCFAVDIWFSAIVMIGMAIEQKYKNANDANDANVGDEILETVDAEIAAPLGTEVLNLKEYPAFDAVNVGANIPEGYGNGKNWDNSFMFKADIGDGYAYASYLLEGKFNKLTLRIQPYNYSGQFGTGSSAELQLIDLDTGKIVYTESMASGSLPIDIEADISGIENLRINVKKTSGLSAYCILSDIYAYPGEGER